jgi:hypothetical protein
MVTLRNFFVPAVAWSFGLLANLTAAAAHCDTLNGPVVAAARDALQTGDVRVVLVWVQPKGESEIREAFARAQSVRRLGPEAKELADLYFFETVVRVHRQGEGAPYTGLKAAGKELGPAIPAADEALRSGNPEPLAKLLTGAAAEGIRQRFKQTAAKRAYRKDDVANGREYVAAYVDYIHYIERLHDAATKSAAGHYPEDDASAHHDRND